MRFRHVLVTFREPQIGCVGVVMVTPLLCSFLAIVPRQRTELLRRVVGQAREASRATEYGRMGLVSPELLSQRPNV